MALTIDDSFPGRWDIWDAASGSAFELHEQYGIIKEWCVATFGTAGELWWWADAGWHVRFIFRKEEYVTLFVMRWA